MTTTGRRLAAIVLALAALAVPAGGAAGSDPWPALHRPLHLPARPSGASCPVTAAALVAAGIAVAGQGTGPIFPADAYPTLRVIPGGRKGQPWFPSHWSGGQVRWLARPSFSGPVLIRGRKVDGKALVGFGPARRPSVELHLVIPRRGPRTWWTGATYARVQSPGCYAWQIDGPRFSRVVVFRVVRA